MSARHTSVVVLVAGVAFVQVAAVGLFAAFTVSGDEYGIATAMAALLALPLVCLTLPAFLLFRRGREGWAAVLAILSLLAVILLWRFA